MTADELAAFLTKMGASPAAPPVVNAATAPVASVADQQGSGSALSTVAAGANVGASPPSDASLGRFASIVLSPTLAAAGPERNQRIADAATRLAGQGAFGAPAMVGAQFASPQGDDKASLAGLSQRSQTVLGLDPSKKPAPYVSSEINPAPTLDPRYGQLAPVSMGGGAGGSGNGLKAKLDAAQYEQVRALAGEESLTRDLGNATVQRVAGVADLEAAEAMRQRQEALQQQQIDMAAQQRARSFLSKTADIVDTLSTQKIDPTRLLRNADNATHFTMGLGAALGGGNAMLNGQNGNSSLDRVEKIIDRDIDSQIQNFNNERANIGARNSVFGQMMAETGDQRVAANATRILLLEASKQKMQSDAARLGIPEVQAKADLATNAIDQKLKGFYAELAAGAYKTYLQQMAAAAAAQKAAEAAAWQRQKDIAELQLKARGQDIDLEKARLEAGKTAGKADEAAIAETTKRLGDDDIVKNRDLINSLYRKVDKNGDVIGLSKTDQVRRALQPSGINTVNPVAYGINAVAGLNEEERNANKEWEQAKLLYQTKVTGTGGSDAQMQAIGRAFDGANTMSEKRHAINMLYSELQRREGLAYANLSDEQRAEVNRRLAREGQTEMPNTVKVKK